MNDSSIEEIVFSYLDQNVLIKLGFKALGNPEFAIRLTSQVENGTLRVVVSTWHLIETANTSKVENAVRLADFIDSLRPAWLLEKYDITRCEVQEDFFRFAKVDHAAQPRIGTRSAAIAAVNRAKDHPKFDIPSRRFVQQWIKHPEQLDALKKQYENGVKALTWIRQAVKEGRITNDVRKQVNRIFLKEHVPSLTPSGLQLPRDLLAEYIERADVSQIPTIVIESAISEHEWKGQGGADRNTQIDKFHLIGALPYVDEIVSEDEFFHLAYPVALKTGYVRAKLLRFDDLLRRF